MQHHECITRFSVAAYRNDLLRQSHQAFQLAAYRNDLLRQVHHAFQRFRVAQRSVAATRTRALPDCFSRSCVLASAKFSGGYRCCRGPFVIYLSSDSRRYESPTRSRHLGMQGFLPMLQAKVQLSRSHPHLRRHRTSPLRHHHLRRRHR